MDWLDKVYCYLASDTAQQMFFIAWNCMISSLLQLAAIDQQYIHFG